MKKFGFGSKKDDGGDQSRTGLFGRKKESPNPQNDNPYAQEPMNDPYSNSGPTYTAPSPQPPRQGLPGGPRPGGPSGLPSGPGPRTGPSQGGPPPPYSNQAGSGGYTSEKYGASGGYGSNRYDANYDAFAANQQLPSISSSSPALSGASARQSPYVGSSPALSGASARQSPYVGSSPALSGLPSKQSPYMGSSPALSGSSARQSPYVGSTSSDSPQSTFAPGGFGSQPGARRPGGYGGLGDLDTNRDDLFGGAGGRYLPKETPPGRRELDSSPKPVDASDSYGGYGADRELTEEEQDIKQAKDYKRSALELQKESLRSQERSMQMLAGAIATGSGTTQLLGSQGDRFRNTQRLLATANNLTYTAADQTRELQTINRSMLAIHVSNPFTAGKRAAAHEQQVVDRYQQEKQVQEEIRTQQYASQQRTQAAYAPLGQITSSGLPVRQRRNFNLPDEGDEEDQSMNRELNENDEAMDGNEDLMYSQVVQLRQITVAMGAELDSHTSLISDIQAKTDEVDEKVLRNTHKLTRIEKS